MRRISIPILESTRRVSPGVRRFASASTRVRETMMRVTMFQGLCSVMHKIPPGFSTRKASLVSLGRSP